MSVKRGIYQREGHYNENYTIRGSLKGARIRRQQGHLGEDVLRSVRKGKGTRIVIYRQEKGRLLEMKGALIIMGRGN